MFRGVVILCALLGFLSWQGPEQASARDPLLGLHECEKYNAAHPGHNYDCAMFCWSFQFYTSRPDQLATMPPDCARYIKPGAKECRVDDVYPPAEGLRLLNNYWGGKFADYVNEYQFFEIMNLSAWPSDTTTDSPFTYYAFSSRGPVEIRYSPEKATAKVQQYGPFSLLILLAHEYGHHVQNLGGRGAPEHSIGVLHHETHEIEFDADRLAGAFLRSLGGGRHCLEAAQRLLLGSGDPPGATGPKYYHGTGPERAACLTYGFDHGAEPFLLRQPGGNFPVNCKSYGGR